MPSQVRGLHAEARENPPHVPSAHLRGKDAPDIRKEATDSVALYSKGKMTPGCFLEFKPASFWINIFLTASLSCF